MFGNRRIRLADINHAQIGDFEEINPGDWRGVDFQRSASMYIYSWENVITRIADLIGDRHVYAIETGSEPPVYVDRAGNIWRDHEYLSPHQYLPSLIPEKI